MTDVANESEVKIETTPIEKAPEQVAQEEAEKRQAERQQQIQMMEQQIAMGRRSITLNCLNLAGAAISFLPHPEEDAEPAKGKKHQPRRLLTLADLDRLDRVSIVIERLTNAVSNCAQPSVPGPMGMGRGPMGR